MADDIVTRLRVIHCAADDLEHCGTCLPCQAADEIDRVRYDNEILRTHIIDLQTVNDYDRRIIIELRAEIQRLEQVNRG